jgi:hemerythrin superfamily protein
METTADSDVIAVLTTDHREVERMFAELQQLGPDQAERRQALAEQVITELVRHSVAEEAYLYPATRRFVPGGDGLADRELTEHAQAEQTMKELEAARRTTRASRRSSASWCRRSPSTFAKRSRSCSRG